MHVSAKLSQNNVMGFIFTLCLEIYVFLVVTSTCINEVHC